MKELTPPPFEIAVDCNGEKHWVEVVEGIPRARAHDVTAERALGILGGHLAPCVYYCDIVDRAPNSLHALERLVTSLHRDARQKVMVTALWKEIGRRMSGNYLEPEFDATDVPVLFRRLGWLITERTQLAGSVPQVARAHVEDTIKKYAAVLLADATALIGIRFEIGRPGVEVLDRPTVRVIIRLPRDWLATVLALGLEQTGTHLTLGATFNADGTITQERLVPSSRLWAVETVREAVPGLRVRPTEEARA